MSALPRTARDDLLDRYGEHDAKPRRSARIPEPGELWNPEEIDDESASDDAAWRAELAEAGWTPQTYWAFIERTRKSGIKEAV